MSNHTDTVTIRLSQEELLFLLKTINVQSLPGMGISPFSNVSKEAVNLLIDAAGRALLARNILVLNENNFLQVDQGVHTAVSTCAYPDQMVAIFLKQGDSSVQQYYFYRVLELSVTHTFPISGVHDLEITTNSDMGASKIDEICREVPGSLSASPIYPISQRSLVQLQELADQQTSAAIDHLITDGIPANYAQMFLNVLKAPDLRLVLQFIYQVVPAVEQKVFTIVANKSGCWMIESTDLGADNVTLQLLPSEQAFQVISEAYKPFKEPLRRSA